MRVFLAAKRRSLWRWWWISAVLSLACLLRLALLDQRLLTANSHLGVLQLQFAVTAEALNAILQTWREMGVLDVARESLVTDFVFMVAYASNFAFACLLVAAGRPVGRWMACVALCCALFDAAENTLQLMMLDRGASAFTAGLNLLCVICKFTLVLASVGFLLLGVGQALKLRLHRA